MKHRLIIDGQIFQTPAWDRGMGKYSLELIAQLDQSGRKQWDSIELLLSTQLPTPSEVIAELNRRTSSLLIANLNLLANTGVSADVARHNRQAVDDYIGKSKTQTVDYLILSLMQNEIYPTFPSARGVKKALLFYDLIPLMLPNAYLSDAVARKKYLTKFPELLNADVYLAISKTAANDLTMLLGVDTERVISIDGGPIRHAATSKKINIPRPFILMPTGNDPRKNNKRGVEAFARFNEERGNNYSLVVTSFFDEQEIASLRELSDKTIFTGNISGEELNYLYNEADGLFFPSEYEGLGLPILEAVEAGKPVACSNVSVFREIAEDAFHLFDPHSVADMAQALTDMIEKPCQDKDRYQKIIETYTWQNTANKLSQAISRAQTGGEKIVTKIAMFGPAPSSKPAGEYLLLGHAELSKRYRVDYYVGKNQEKETARVDFLPYVAKEAVLKPGLGFRISTYDKIYHVIDGTTASTTALFAALAVPGITILAETQLDTVWEEMVAQGLIDKSRYSLEVQLSKDFPVKGAKFLVSLIAAQQVIVVFSKTAKHMIEAVAEKLGSETVVWIIERPKAAPVYEGAGLNRRSDQKAYEAFAESLVNIAKDSDG